MSSKKLNLGIFGLSLAMLFSHSAAHAAPAWESLENAPESGYEATPEEIASSLAQDQIDAPYSTDAVFEQAAHGKVQVLTLRKPKDFDYEFSLLIVNGKIRRTFIVSTAMAGKLPILGIHRLTPVKVNNLPYPWIISHKFDSSPMYWGINIRGGYYIHSSPHYGKLGAPASMGCIRASIPDAMEVFNTVANEFANIPSYSMIYEGFTFSTDSPQARFLNAVLKNSNMTVDDLKAAIAFSRTEVLAVSRSNLAFAKGIPADAHARAFTGRQSDMSDFPSCGGVNCWDAFKKTPRIYNLTPEALNFIAH